MKMMSERIMESTNGLFVGVDVGTSSARAALVTDFGKILSVAVTSIKTWKPLTDHFEQSSENIWEACVESIKNVIKDVSPVQIKGIGFDATCSLVVLSEDFTPLTVSTTGVDDQNVILWMDHRAKKEADFINSTQHPVLKYVGGKVSLEMEMPKLLWLKNNLPETWRRVGYLFDLPDFLTWKATGSNSRSLCSVVCKWNYEVSSADNQNWNTGFLTKIGLSDLLDHDSMKIGNKILSPGYPCGNGLSRSVAIQLGLLPGTPVGTSIIDAHAGGLGMIGVTADNISKKFDSRLGLICGTSTCHMAVSKSPIFVPGVWGPYFSAMVPSFWLNEAGQSASGILIEHIINSHPASKTIRGKCPDGMIVQEYLNQLICNLTVRENLPDCCFLTKDIHVWPDFHGNRSPLADPSLLGMVSGLTLSADEENLALLYLSTLQALSYGTRHIIEFLKKSGHTEFESILICGGLSRNALFVQTQADVVGIPLLSPIESESVLLGAAILGACGANYFPNIESAVTSMGGKANIVRPNESVFLYHECKYQVFLKMLSDQQSYKATMDNC